MQFDRVIPKIKGCNFFAPQCSFYYNVNDIRNSLSNTSIKLFDDDTKLFILLQPDAEHKLCLVSC